MSDNTPTLDNFSLYLWDNPEGFHVTVTTNYNTPKEKRSFFSFGKQTYKSWRAYNLHQPEPILAFFKMFKDKHKTNLKELGNDYCNDYWISKLAVNTGTHGRRTAPGAMILFEVSKSNEYHFIVNFNSKEFKGSFDPGLLSSKQRKGAKGKCLGAYIWKDDSDIQEYAEAF